MRKDNPNKPYSSLPHKKPLSDPKLQPELQKIFDKQAKNASKLCACGSSNTNESFNMTVAAKAPKTKHYSKSESLDFRVAAAVCQKNVGEGYLPKIFQLSGLSPGRVTVNKAASFDRVTEKRRNQQGSKKWKRRRLELKNSNFSSANQKELREGVTYQSSIALSIIDEDATTSIPDMVLEPNVERINDIENFVLVAFNLETTGLSDDCELTQVAAYRFDGQDSFDQYILPVGGISSGAATATGITKRNNQLFLRNRPVDCKDANTALASFADWIDRQEKSHPCRSQC